MDGEGNMRTKARMTSLVGWVEALRNPPVPPISMMVGLAKPRPTLLDLPFQNGGCHAHGFAWAWSEPHRHAHAKPWAWHPFITHHFRTEGLLQEMLLTLVSVDGRVFGRN